MDVIDRAVHNSPPPLDDVAGCAAVDFDERDPMIAHCTQCGLPALPAGMEADLCLYCAEKRRILIDEAVRHTSEVQCVDPEKLLTLLGERVVMDQVRVQFRMLTGGSAVWA